MTEYTGREFGKWRVLSFGERRSRHDGKGQNWWKCRCDCGTVRLVSQKYLREGKSRSCGCEFRSKPIHGQHKTGAYRSWQAMKVRCRINLHYVGLGITVCKRWEKFANFFEDMGPRPAGMSIDRKNGRRGYSPGNCRWADAVTQANNRIR